VVNCINPFALSLPNRNVLVWLCCVFSISVCAEDELFTDYRVKTDLSGNIVATGSDTLASLMAFWAEDFSKLYPAVAFEMHNEGSATAPPALLVGASQIAPMSRRMSDAEFNEFENKLGFLPTEIPVAVDAIALFVHRDNPLEGITLNQLAAIFSSDGDCIEHKKVTTWGELGLDDAWRYKHIEAFGRNADSGSYSFFKDTVLCQSSFNEKMINLPGSGSIVQAVSYNPYAIGFSGKGYKTSGVKTLPILINGKATLPTNLNNTEWVYPLSRYLYLYVINPPNRPISEVTREFVTFVLSKQGQKIVELDGYVSIPPQLAQLNIDKIN
jgi:phosphate transport system substrate-binding protein